jgi:hypothetical protein
MGQPAHYAADGGFTMRRCRKDGRYTRLALRHEAQSGEVRRHRTPSSLLWPAGSPVRHTSLLPGGIRLLEQ